MRPRKKWFSPTLRYTQTRRIHYNQSPKLWEILFYSHFLENICAPARTISTPGTPETKLNFIGLAWKFICETIVYVQICLKIMSKVLVIVAGFRFGRGWFRYSLLNYLQKLWKVELQRRQIELTFSGIFWEINHNFDVFYLPTPISLRITLLSC